MSSNKVKFGLKNVHIAKQTVTDGVYSYAVPVALPGAVSMTLDAQGEVTPFYADDVVYYRSTANNGYSGSLEIAYLPDWFRKDILQEEMDIHNVLVEKADKNEDVRFAMLFEFQGDVKAVRHVVYNISASRPSTSSQTKEAATSPVTESINIQADPRDDDLVKARTSDTTDNATYNNWYSAVYIPTLRAS